MATAALGGPNNRQYTNWVKIAAIAAALLGVGAALLIFVRYYLLAPSAPIPKSEAGDAASLGRAYPTHKATPAVATAATGLPKPKVEPQQRVKDTAKQAAGKPPPTDDILTSPAEFQNTDHGSAIRTVKAAAISESRDGAPVDPRRPGEAEKDPFAETFRASHFPTAHAYVDNHSFYKISAGRKIHCQTNTWINSQLAGFYTCDIPEDVTNDKGTLVLLPKGSHAFGQIRSGLVPGQDRLLAIFSEIRTDDEPEVKVVINSPAADALGSAGIPVTVNNFFLQNLLATSVYAVLDAAPLLFASEINRSNNNNNVTNFTQITQPETSLAGRMLNERLKRPPLGEAAPVKNVVIFVNQDIDCYDAVQVRMRRGLQVVAR